MLRKSLGTWRSAGWRFVQTSCLIVILSNLGWAGDVTENVSTDPGPVLTGVEHRPTILDSAAFLKSPEITPPPLGFSCWDVVSKKASEASNLNRRPFKDGLIMDDREPTVNKFGFNSPPNDLISRLWIEDTKSVWWEKSGRYRRPPGTTWELAAAWGAATRTLLNKNRLAQVYVNDMDAVHLNAGYRRVPLRDRSRYIRVLGSIPYDLHIPGDYYVGTDGNWTVHKLPIPMESMWNVLIADVVHFMSGSEIEDLLHFLFPRLLIGGSLYIKAFTPHVADFESFLPIYEERLDENEAARARNAPEPWPWPGYVDSVKTYAPLRAGNLPPSVHFMDLEVLTRSCQKYGYEVTLAGYLNGTGIIPAEMEDKSGKTIVGIICTKTRREMIPPLGSR